MRSSSSAGSRSTRHAPRAASLLELELVRGAQHAQPPVRDQPLVDGAEPAGERRVDGHAERDRLAVHRAAGRDDEVGERDEALRVDGVLGHDERRRAPAPRSSSRCSAVRAARRPARLGSRPSRSQHVREERVPVPVVERDVGRRADDDEHAVAVEPELVEHGGVGLEAREVVLLLQPRVAAHLRGARAEPVEARPAGSRPERRRGGAARQPSPCWTRANS